MKKRIVLYLLTLSLGSLPALAQENETVVEPVGWARFSLSKKLTPRIRLSVAPQLIISDKFSRLSGTLTDFGLTYKIIPNLSLKGTYRLSTRHRPGEAISTRHQLLLNVGTSHRITSRLKLYYRFRYQTRSPELLRFMYAEAQSSREFIRNRLKARYSVNYYLRPWITYELFHRIGHRRRGNYLRADRLLLGLDWRINDDNKINIFAGPQSRRDRDDRPVRLIFGTSYSHRL
jgi:hypothetical protein